MNIFLTLLLMSCVGYGEKYVCWNIDKHYTYLKTDRIVMFTAIDYVKCKDDNLDFTRGNSVQECLKHVVHQGCMYELQAGKVLYSELPCDDK